MRARRTVAAIAAALSLLVAPHAQPSYAELETASEAVVCTPVAGHETAPEGSVPFQSTAQGNVFDHGPPRSLLVVTSKPDPIVVVVNPEAAGVVSGVDLTTNLLVGLFIGRFPQVGHHVAIESVRTVGSDVCITAVVTGPGAGEDASDAEEYPYHVVTVPRDAVPLAAGTTWTVVSPDGAVLATTRTH